MKLIKSKTVKRLILGFGLIALVFPSNANTNVIKDTTKSKNNLYRQAQVSLIAPIGTNGLESYRIANKLSLNIFAGVNGGLDGAAFSGWVDVELGNVRGFQFAGWANANTHNTNGVQIAGLANLSQGKLDGVQFSGITSVGLSNSIGAQFSGITSIVVGDLKGAQFSGIASVVTESSNATQFSGIVNTVLGSTKGFQGAGIANFSAGNKMGQVSGVFNGNHGDLKGVQISSIANINTNKVEGFQASGLVNFTRVLKGVQLGVFNYTDSIESGAVIGFLSFVRNGYHSLGVTSNESLYGNVEFRTGTHKFYNILSLGTAGRDSEFYWGYGYGIGTKVQVGKKVDLNLETVVYHINEGTDHTDRLNLLNKYQITASFPIGNFMKLAIGPSFNLFINEGEQIEDGTIQFSKFAPYSVFDKTYDNETNVTMYPGLSIGLHF